MIDRRAHTPRCLPALVALCLAATTGAGCSFRLPTHVDGVVTALSTSGPLLVAVPFTVTAQAAYRGAFKDPALSVAMGTDAPLTIRVRAVAQWEAPFLGFGAFQVPHSVVRTAEIRTTLTVERPGRYVLESVPPDSSAVIRTTFEVEGP